MNDDHRCQDFENLDPQLETAVKAVLAEPIPEDPIQRVKMRARQLSADALSTPLTPSSRMRSWKAARRALTGLAAAAVLLALVFVGAALLDHSGGQAFAQMIEKVKAIRSVHFTTATQFGFGPEVKGVMYLEDNRLRQEQLDGMVIGIFDLDRKQALLLDTPRKIAQSADLDAELTKAQANPIDQLRRIRSAA